jgi:hypothetical protein
MTLRFAARTTTDGARLPQAGAILGCRLQGQCYNPIFPRDLRFRMSFRGQRVLFFLPLAILVALIFTTPASAQEWDAPAHELAEKIIAHAQSRGGLSLTVKNMSSLPASRVAEVQHALESELRRRGVSLVEPERAMEQARVTFSENTAGYLWVAEIGHDDSWDVVMLQTRLPMPAAQSPAVLVLRRTPLWSQHEPMLDVIASGDGDLFVLGRDSVSLYRMQDKKWQLASTSPLAHSRPWARDLRGRLMIQADGTVHAYLPGVHCSGAMEPQLNLACKESDDPWPLAPEVNGFFSSRRNFFTGAVKLAGSSEAGNLGPFYSVAVFPQGERGFWIVAFVDGSVQLINAQGQVVTAFNGWGSDLAGIASDCGSGWQVLATRAADYTLPDSLAAYEIVNRDAVEAEAPLEFAGPITAMWCVADGRSATVIVHSLRTGTYEAFSVSAACGR